jgi:hypothetical protein
MNDREELKRIVRNFIENQEGHNSAFPTDPLVSFEDMWFVSYGYESQFTISGFGATPNEAFESFVTNWNSLNGFKGIKENMLEVKMLKDKVLSFVEQQSGYPGKHEKIKAWGGNFEWVALYGEDAKSGVAGVGSAPALAFENFVNSWNELKGFEWISNNRSEIPT